jgi:hypothetical protein
MIRPLLGLLVLTTAAPAIGSAAERPTRVVPYTATDAITGRLRSGYSVVSKASGSCWIGSLSATRPEAWRCMVGTRIRDPCFAPATNAHVVYHPGFPNRKRQLAIALTKPCRSSSRTTARPALAERPLSCCSPAACHAASRRERRASSPGCVARRIFIHRASCCRRTQYSTTAISASSSYTSDLRIPRLTQ